MKRKEDSVIGPVFSGFKVLNTLRFVKKGERFLTLGRVKYQVRIYVIFLLKTNSGVLNLNFSLGLSLILF